MVATDIDCRYLARLDLPNLEVVRHNIVEDPLDVLGLGSFDVVCARLVSFWLAGRQEAAIHNMVQCLRPGGWLVDEEGDWGVPGPVDPSHLLYPGYRRAFQGGDWSAARGYDPFFGRTLPALFERCGLQNIDNQATAGVVRGGSLWARWWQQNLDVIRAWGLTSGGPAEASMMSIRRSRRPAATHRSGSSPSSCTPVRADVPVNQPRICAYPAGPGCHQTR